MVASKSAMFRFVCAIFFCELGFFLSEKALTHVCVLKPCLRQVTLATL
jgi:hypothetical protein